MPAPLDVDRDAVKAHAITHGLRRAAEHFGLPLSTVGSWSERDPTGPWCPANVRKLPTVARPPTVQPQPRPTANAANAAQIALTKLGDRSRLNMAKAVDNGMAHAANLDGESVLAVAPTLASLAKVGQVAFPDWRSEATGSSMLGIAITVRDSAQVVDVEATVIEGTALGQSQQAQIEED